MIDAAGRIAELEALHARFPLAGSPPNGLLSADPALLEYLLSVLREDPAPPPARSAEEWQACLSLLDGHSARPILASLLLKQPAPFRPPAGVVDRLRRELFHSAATVMRGDRVLATLLERLRDRGIAPLLLKGAALSRSVYPDAAMRQGSDIDLLVREDELEACAEVIVGMGYRAPYDFHAFSPFTTPHQVYLPPARAPAARPLELHWGLGQGFAQDHDRLEGLFSRSISVPYPAFEFRTLGHADHLAFCAHHALYHHGNAVRLVWICDLAYLSRVLTRTDWQALPGRAVAHRARFATETGLRMASAWTGLPEPARLDRFGGWPEPARTEVSDWDNVAWSGSPTLGVLRMQLHFIPSPLGKVRYLLGIMVPPEEKVLFDCPEMRPPPNRRALGALHLHRWLSHLKKL